MSKLINMRWDDSLVSRAKAKAGPQGLSAYVRGLVEVDLGLVLGEGLEAGAPQPKTPVGGGAKPPPVPRSKGVRKPPPPQVPPLNPEPQWVADPEAELPPKDSARTLRIVPPPKP